MAYFNGESSKQNFLPCSLQTSFFKIGIFLTNKKSILFSLDYFSKCTRFGSGQNNRKHPIRQKGWKTENSSKLEILPNSNHFSRTPSASPLLPIWQSQRLTLLGLCEKGSATLGGTRPCNISCIMQDDFKRLSWSVPLFNSLTGMAMGAHERPLFDKLLWLLVTSMIFVHC